MYWITGRHEHNVSLNDIVANVGMHACSEGCNSMYPPQGKCTAHPKQTVRQYFWEQWDALVREAKNTQRWSQTQWVRHLHAKNDLLRLAPQTWLRRLHAFARKPLLPLDGPRTWIYAIWSTRTSRIYIGQTRGIRSLKRVITRFLQHYRSARSWNQLFGRKGVRGLGLLYPTMFRLGPEGFGIVPIERCSRSAADAREQFWIRKMAHTLNVRGVYTSTCRWNLLLHSGLVTPRYSTAQLARLAHRISDSIHCDVPLHTQLKILTWAKKHFAGPLRNRCFREVAYRVQ